MKNIAPHITRQRLLLEGFYTIDVDEAVLTDYLHAVAKHLDLRAYA